MRTKQNSSCIKTFCENLNLLVKERGIPQKAICDATGITQATFSRMVHGDRNPSLDTVYKIAKYFDVSIDELVGIKAEKSEFNKNQLKKELNFANKVRKLLDELYEDNNMDAIEGRKK